MSEVSRKVAHALFRYVDGGGFETWAVRREVIFLSESEAARGDATGALVPADAPILGEPGYAEYAQAAAAAAAPVVVMPGLAADDGRTAPGESFEMLPQPTRLLHPAPAVPARDDAWFEGIA